MCRFLPSVSMVSYASELLIRDSVLRFVGPVPRLRRIESPFPGFRRTVPGSSISRFRYIGAPFPESRPIDPAGGPPCPPGATVPRSWLGEPWKGVGKAVGALVPRAARLSGSSPGPRRWKDLHRGVPLFCRRGTRDILGTFRTERGAGKFRGHFGRGGVRPRRRRVWRFL